MRVGIMGGGQLAQMMTQAAISLGLETAIFERTPDTPASRLTHHQLVGDWSDEMLLARFVQLCDVITLESEFVDASVLARIEQMGKPLFPTARTVALVQDKLIQKETMQAAGIALPKFRAVDDPKAIEALGAKWGYPLVLKARRDGYDGYGNATIQTPDEIQTAWERLGGSSGRLLFVEAFVPFAHELAVMVVRGRDGVTRTYPVVETIQQNHICHVVRAPAQVITPHQALIATTMALAAVQAIDGVGIFGVELFLLHDGTIWFNEIAPRPHNSGHYTIEACLTSQFENHLRAILGWPLGDTQLIAPFAVMVNVLGRHNGPAHENALRKALALGDIHIHMYGKRESRVGRKMGHVTVLGGDMRMAEDKARRAVDLIEL